MKLITRIQSVRTITVGVALVALTGLALSGCTTTDPTVDPGPDPTATGSTDVGELFPELSFLPEGPSDELVAAAEAESGRLTTYLSFTPADMEPIFAAFREQYPFVDDAETVELAASKVSAQIVQETQGGGTTADYGETPANFLLDLLDRDLLLELDGEALGVPPEMMENPYMVTVSSNLYALAINTDLVDEADRPQTWDDLLDEQWSGGKIAIWNQPAALGNLAPAWGEDELLSYVQEFVAQEPVFISSPTAVVQAISAGETPIGISTYHQVAAEAERGAPIAWYPLDVVSVSVSQAYVPAGAENPATGQLFLAWFASEGYQLKEERTYRGVPNLPGPTQDVVAGASLSGWGTDESSAKAAIEAKVAELFPRG